MAVPLALIAARNLVPVPVAVATRGLLETLRAVPGVIWGLVLVTVIGVGPDAGAFALGLHSAGVLGKLYAECCENVRRAPVNALEATGASAGGRMLRDPAAGLGRDGGPHIVPAGMEFARRDRGGDDRRWRYRSGVVRRAAVVLLQADDGLCSDYLGDRHAVRWVEPLDAAASGVVGGDGVSGRRQAALVMGRLIPVALAAWRVAGPIRGIMRRAGE